MQPQKFIDFSVSLITTPKSRLYLRSSSGGIVLGFLDMRILKNSASLILVIIYFNTILLRHIFRRIFTRQIKISIESGRAYF